MRSHFITSALTIALAVATPIVGSIAFPAGAIAQQQTSELDRAIAEGTRLTKKGVRNL